MIINEFIPNNSILNSMVGTDNSSNSSSDAVSGSGIDFGTVLKNKLSEVNDKQIDADNLSTQFIEGGDVSVDQVMLGAEEAKMSLQMAVQVRNKIVDAYQELNKMQV